MKNIVWKKPDGGVAVTHIVPEAAAQMEWAASYAWLLPQQDTLALRLADLDAQITAFHDEIARARIARVVALEAGDILAANTATDTETTATVRAEALTPERIETRDKLLVIERVKKVRDLIGLNSHDHENILRQRGDVPAEHVCVGHDLGVPVSRLFRDAWTHDGATVTHDIPKCRAIQADRIRAARVPKFAELDYQYQRADEASDEIAKAAVVAQKQLLRDAPADPALAAASTPEEIAAVWPDVLKGA